MTSGLAGTGPQIPRGSVRSARRFRLSGRLL